MGPSSRRSASAAVARAQVGLADSVIDQFLILVHPCAWAAAGGVLDAPCLAREEEVRKRWAAAITSLPPSTFVVQVDYARNFTANQLHQWFIDRLGAGHVTRIPVRVVGPSTPGPLKEYYEEIHQQIRRQMTNQGLTFDPATAKATIWGESFEGCAPSFGSAIASCLGLKTATQFDFDMSVPDACLLEAAFLQTVAVPDSDVEAYLFDLNDGRLAAFFRSALTPQGLDHRPIELQLDAGVFSVLTKHGATVWPQEAPPTGAQRVTLSTVQARFLTAPRSHMTELLSAIKEAEVGPQTTEVVDTFSRADSTLLGYAESPACMYPWHKTALTTGPTAAGAAEIAGSRLHIPDSDSQAILGVNFKDVRVSTDVMFGAVSGSGDLPGGSAGIMLRKPTLDAGVWDAEEAEKIAVEIAPSGFIRVAQVPTGGGVNVLAGVNPWTESTSWSWGPAGSLPATFNDLPFDADGDGRLSGEVFEVSVTLVGHDVHVSISGRGVLSATVASTSNSNHNYVSLFANQVGCTGRTQVYFDSVRVRLVGA